MCHGKQISQGKMGLHYFWFISTAILLLSVSSLTVNPHVQGCSFLGIELQHCLAPSTITPLSRDSCCTTLNQAIRAGYFCLCSLLGPYNYPVFSNELQLSFSKCYISMPSLTHCHEPLPVGVAPPAAALPQPIGLAPPVAALPQPVGLAPPVAALPPPVGLAPPVSTFLGLKQPPPLSPPSPPDLPRDDIFVPLLPKVNEIPINSREENSSTLDSNPSLSSSPQPMVTIPERWDYASSDAANVEFLLLSINLLILALFSYSIA